jgi:hypothetical protein
MGSTFWEDSQGSVGDIDPETSEDDEMANHFPYPFEDYDHDEEQYLGELTLRHLEHMEYFILGFYSNQKFVQEAVHDIYISNVYAMSWFYNGAYPFDSYEADIECYLYEQAYLEMNMENS